MTETFGGQFRKTGDAHPGIVHAVMLYSRRRRKI
jgi:hypothetical protein